MRENLTSVFILIAAFLISVAIYFAFDLDTLQKLFSILGSLSLGVALAAYFYKKNQDKDIAAIEQISFFRREIIPEWDKVSKILRSKNSSYIFSRIRLKEFSIEFMREHYPKNFKDQLNIFFNDPGDSSKDLWDANILDPQVVLFNMLEEFALRVLHFKTNNHQALNSVRNAFIEIIEKNAVALIFVRDIVTGNPIYSATLQLYLSWNQNLSRTYALERLEKHGLITGDQLEKIAKK